MSIGSKVVAGCLCLAVWLIACGEDDLSVGAGAITPQALDAHLRFLASDLLEGRAAGTAGSELAAAYIATQFRLVGLTPAIGDSSYLQPVPLVARTSEARLRFRAPGGAAYTPEPGTEFVAWSRDSAEVSRPTVELVFVGHGIRAPEFNWDDYKSADVRGKVLLILADDPGRYLQDRFRGDTATYYGLVEYKLAEAARLGAVGVLLVHSPDVGPSWNSILSVRTGEQVDLEGPSERPILAYAGWLRQEAAEQVVAMAGLDFATLLESARSESFRPVATGMLVTAAIQTVVRRFSDVNVAGLLPGSHPQLARQLVIVSAHYDHLGVGEPVESDSIYNGAYDNASGTALLLCLADAFSRLPQRPARSMLFLALTAEEPGLLGSRAYVNRPLVPLDRTMANINIDGVNLWGLTEDIVVFGAELSTLRSAARRAAEAENMRWEADRSPQQGYIYRSDQFTFMRAGVPAVLVGHGLDYIGQMPGWGEQVLAHYAEHVYNRPSDEYRSDFNLRGAVQQGRVAFRLGLEVANVEERPTWRSGAETAFLK